MAVGKNNDPVFSLKNTHFFSDCKQSTFMTTTTREHPDLFPIQLALQTTGIKTWPGVWQVKKFTHFYSKIIAQFYTGDTRWCINGKNIPALRNNTVIKDHISLTYHFSVIQCSYLIWQLQSVTAITPPRLWAVAPVNTINEPTGSWNRWLSEKNNDPVFSLKKLIFFRPHAIYFHDNHY